MRFFSRLAGVLKDGGYKKAVLCAVAESEGSVPRGAGALLAVCFSGNPDLAGIKTIGTIGGGAVEFQVVKLSEDVLRSGVTRHMRFEFNTENAAELGMACGGAILVIMMPLENDALTAIERAATLEAAGGHFLTLYARPGYPAGLNICDVSDGVALHCANQPEKSSRGEPHPVWDGSRLVLPLGQSGRVLVFGAGHISRCLAPLLDTLSFPVTVVDDRAEFAEPALFPASVTVCVMPFEDALSRLEVSSYDYVVIVTRGHLHDYELLSQALRTNVRYIGMIGSKNKVSQVFERLIREDGFLPADLNRVCAPIGLPLGGDTPEEIAVSIAAQLIRYRSGICS